MPVRGGRVPVPGFALGRDLPVPTQYNLAAIAAGYLAAYVFLDWASSMHALQGLAITPWNPQGGLSLTLLLLFGIRFAPLLVLSALIGDVIVRQLPAPLHAAALAALAPAVGYGALAWFLKRRLARDLALRSVRNLAVLMAGGLVATAFVAVATAAIYVGFRVLPATSFADAVLRYWIGDYVGIAVLTPFLLRLPGMRWRIRRPLEIGLQAALLVAVWSFVFLLEYTDEFKFFFLFFVPVTWITLRHGLTGAAFAGIAVQIGLIYATTISGKDARTVIELQLLMLTLAIASQFTGVVVDERRAEEAGRVALRDQLSHVGRITVSGEIASGVAHELNQPLSAVVNYVHAALIDNRAANMPGETVRVLEKAEEQALRAGETVRRLRDFLRRGEMQLSTLIVRDAIADAVSLVRQAAERADVAIVLRPMPDTLRALGDRVHLTQVLVNLTNNAIEALQASAPHERQIELSAGEAAGGWIEVSVADSGSGVPPEHRERIFDSFYTTKATGMGLGLAISRSLVEAQGGRLWYAPPSPGRRGSFRFTLPAAPQEQA
jgi:two-component system sensor kinase FixL